MTPGGHVDLFSQRWEGGSEGWRERARERIMGI